MEEIERVRAGREQGIVKLIVTRGSGGRGYGPPAAPQPRRLLAWHPLPPHPQAHYRGGVSVWLTATRIGRSPALAGLKHLGRLEQVLASSEQPPAGCVEGLMREPEGALIEGIRSNLFLVRSGRIETPRLDQSGVAGVMRQLVLAEAAELGLGARECRIDVETLVSADEVFLSNSVFGLWPVTALAEPAARWAVGPITRRLMARAADRGVPEWAG